MIVTPEIIKKFEEVYTDVCAQSRQDYKPKNYTSIVLPEDKNWMDNLKN